MGIIPDPPPAYRQRWGEPEDVVLDVYDDQRSVLNRVGGTPEGIIITFVGYLLKYPALIPCLGYRFKFLPGSFLSSVSASHFLPYRTLSLTCPKNLSLHRAALRRRHLQ